MELIDWGTGCILSEEATSALPSPSLLIHFHNLLHLVSQAFFVALLALIFLLHKQFLISLSPPLGRLPSWLDRRQL